MKYIINWPSGAGGDFFTSLIFLLKYPDDLVIDVNPLHNLWQVTSPKLKRAVRLTEYEDNLKIFNSLERGDFLQTHFVDEMLVKTPGAKTINIYASNIVIKSYLKLMHTLKTNDKSDFPCITDSSHEFHYDNVLNISYSDIYWHKTQECLESILQYVDITDYDIDLLLEILNLYFRSNEKLAISPFLCNEEFFQVERIRLTSFQEIKLMYEFDFHSQIKIRSYAKILSDWKKLISK